jgi:hypothetical protein
MNVLPYAHPQLCKVFKHLLYMYGMDMGCSLKGSTASTIAYWATLTLFQNRNAI